MNLLMLGVGDLGLDEPLSDPVLRHQEYARRMGGHIDLVVDSPRRGRFEYGPGLTVHLVGASRALYVPSALRLAETLAARSRPDLITSQDPFATALVGLLLRRRLRRPLIVQNHSSFMSDAHWLRERPFLFRLLRHVGRFTLRRADGWRVVNSIERQYYIDRLGLPPAGVRFLPETCDIQGFLRTPPEGELAARRASLGIEPGAQVCLWVGRPVRVKRLPVLLAAFREIRQHFGNARLVLVGDRKFAQENLLAVESRLDLGNSVIWTGPVAFGELPACYAIADVLLLTSAYEGFGRVLVEAGAARLPVVATATAGAREIVRDGETGLLVPVDDVRAIAARTCELLADGTRRRKMGAAGRTWVRREFDPEQAFERIVAHWREVARQEEV